MYQSVHKHYSNLISKKQGHWRSLGILMHNFNGVSFLVVNLIETPPCWSINKSSEHLRMNMGADNLFHLFNIITVSFSSIHALGKKKKKKKLEEHLQFQITVLLCLSNPWVNYTNLWQLMHPKELRQDIIFTNIIFCKLRYFDNLLESKIFKEILSILGFIY